ncbi:MAG TPA: cell division protein FtsQ/DivIB [Gammaproteobacteria bacterium]
MPGSARIDLREWPDPRADKPRRTRIQVVRRTEIAAAEQPRLLLRRGMLVAGIILITIVPAASLVKWYAQSFEVQAVTIEGEFHNEQAHAVEQALLPYVKGDFFTADLAGARTALLNLSWVRNVSLRRRWPNRIIVKIEEQVPVAVWNQDRFLNDAATAFNHGYIDDSRVLPSLSGPEDSAQEVMSRFLLWQGWFETAGLRLQSVSLDQRRSWMLVTTDGITIDVGTEKIEARLQRFLEIFPQHLKARINEVKTIDLRYSNGFAVSWKSPVMNAAVKGNRDVQEIRKRNDRWSGYRYFQGRSDCRRDRIFR